MIIVRTAPNIFEHEGIRFMPGTNHVPDDLWEKWKKLPNHNHLMQQFDSLTPAMQVVSKSKEKGVSTAAASADPGITPKAFAAEIGTLSIPKAIELVKNTLRMDYLEEIKQTEKRKKVAEAIAAQIKEMKRKPAAEELQGGIKQSEAPPTGNLMDNLNIKHDHREPDKY